ncbi:MAG TPA: ABC transporter ATP-binding protein [Methanofastidiosum sp.]|nr:ABC transporter ATP-binding protein [Methanofastidiosum sp.]
MDYLKEYLDPLKVKKTENISTHRNGKISAPIEGGLEFTNTALPDILELKNIKQVYGDHVVFDGKLHFLVEDKPEQGQFISLLGTSGCGKSTLLRYICGLQEPTSGEILINGKPRTREDRVGMVFQQYSSLPWYTVYQNVELGLKYQNHMGKKERHEKVMKFIELVGLTGHEDKYAQYPTLSGGQLQRVSIARSLIVEPPIIVMDEPFGALDVRTRLQMQELLARIWMDIQTTIIFVTHDIPEAVFLGDDLFIMKANPGEFVHYHHVELPLERTRELKRDPYFNKLVYQVEDEMMELASKK